MTICCLDQATKNTGYSIWCDGKLIKYGVLSVGATSDGAIDRMIVMRNKIRNLIVENKPDYICFEDVQRQANPQVFKMLAQFQGMMFALLYDIDVGFCIVEPSCWKSYFGVKSRKRQEQKNETIQLVKNKYKIEVTEDEADSIAIGYWAINNLTVIKGETNG